eukprot:TRINITY_DN10559_c0_g1_i2.p1 TRINITY_DN10559_c0_g1~~TRINITY_DN10559_c0_g1_i2.p1  ORF type:complete len:583 (-),score=111.80 TRINITY_DN10559_c0_g1_i2:725-2473(-)
MSHDSLRDALFNSSNSHDTGRGAIYSSNIGSHASYQDSGDRVEHLIESTLQGQELPHDLQRLLRLNQRSISHWRCEASSLKSENEWLKNELEMTKQALLSEENANASLAMEIEARQQQLILIQGGSSSTKMPLDVLRGQLLSDTQKRYERVKAQLMNEQTQYSESRQKMQTEIAILESRLSGQIAETNYLNEELARASILLQAKDRYSKDLEKQIEENETERRRNAGVLVARLEDTYSELQDTIEKYERVSEEKEKYLNLYKDLLAHSQNQEAEILELRGKLELKGMEQEALSATITIQAKKIKDLEELDANRAAERYDRMLSAKTEQFEAEKRELSEKIDELTASLRDLERRHETERSKDKSLEEECQALSQANQYLEGVIKSTTSDLDEANSRISSLGNNLQESKQAYEHLSRMHNLLKDEATNMKLENARLTKELALAGSVIKQLEDDVKTMRDSNRQASKTETKLTHQIAQTDFHRYMLSKYSQTFTDKDQEISDVGLSADAFTQTWHTENPSHLDLNKSRDQKLDTEEANTSTSHAPEVSIEVENLLKQERAHMRALVEEEKKQLRQSMVLILVILI